MSISSRMCDRLRKLYRLVLNRMHDMDVAWVSRRTSVSSVVSQRSSINTSIHMPSRFTSRLGMEQLEPRTLLSSAMVDHGAGGLAPDLSRLNPSAIYVDSVYTQQAAAQAGTSPNGDPVIAQGTVAGIPAMSSRPGAAYTLYLNFGGFSFSGNWGGQSQYTPGNTPAYDNNGDATSFSATEIANIKNVWSRVAEKYAAFDINVTTVDPAIAAGQAASDLARQTYYDSQARMMHTVIGGNDTWLPNAGGVSYVNVTPYSATNSNGYHTNWVFSAQAPNFIQFIAEGVAHENGHGLGLYHQADYNGNSLVNSYSDGNSFVAPIMGDSYYTQRGLWSVGTVKGNNGLPKIQNDVLILANVPGMNGFVDDGIGQFMAAATPIPLILDAVDYTSAKGIIHPDSASNPQPMNAADYTSDWWVFSTDGGPITLSSVAGRSTINPGVADPGATLHTAMNIYDSLGALVTQVQSSNLTQTYSGVLAAGDYYLEILPVGNIVDSNPSFTDRVFFDMGSYFLTGSGLVDLEANPQPALTFDFGTTGSPLSDGATRVTESTIYSAGLAYGWQSGVIDSRDRGPSAGATFISRDLNFTSNGVFAVDLANGSYNVTVQLGDTAYAHDSMGVFIEGTQYDTVTTAAGQVSSRTYNVTVADGQLNLGLQDLAGPDANVSIVGLEIASTSQTNTPPSVTDIDKEITQEGTLAFTASDFISAFSDADAGDVLQTVKLISLPTQGSLELDGVTVTLNQEITTSDLDQLTYTPAGGFVGSDSFNWNGSDGSLYANQSGVVNLTVNPLPALLFDFGTTTSPLMADFNRVSELTTYNQSLGYGWQSGVVQSRDRGGFNGATAVDQDLNFTNDAVFAVDVANGSYNVTIMLGDKAAYVHDQMGVFLENAQYDRVTTAFNQVVSVTYTVFVADGQLTLGLKDLGGVDANVCIVGLVITSNEPQNNLPVLSDINKSVDQNQTLSFSVSDFINAFSDADAGDSLQEVKLLGVSAHGVVRLNGTPITLGQTVAVNDLANLTYTPDAGYSGPDFISWTGSDGSDYAGSTAMINLTVNALSSYKFDFGTAGSPLDATALRVSEITTYNQTRGYGWQSGLVQSRDRGPVSGATALTRDLNFTNDAVFAVDVANGSYSVTVHLGDAGEYSHEQMGVSLEGTLYDSVNTSAGQVVSRTFNVNVVDGQLSVRLQDLGGVDLNVCITGLEIVPVG